MGPPSSDRACTASQPEHHASDGEGGQDHRSGQSRGGRPTMAVTTPLAIMPKYIASAIHGPALKLGAAKVTRNTSAHRNSPKPRWRSPSSQPQRPAQRTLKPYRSAPVTPPQRSSPVQALPPWWPRHGSPQDCQHARSTGQEEHHEQRAHRRLARRVDHLAHHLVRLLFRGHGFIVRTRDARRRSGPPSPPQTGRVGRFLVRQAAVRDHPHRPPPGAVC